MRVSWFAYHRKPQFVETRTQKDFTWCTIQADSISSTYHNCPDTYIHRPKLRTLATAVVNVRSYTTYVNMRIFEYAAEIGLDCFQ